MPKKDKRVVVFTTIPNPRPIEELYELFYKMAYDDFNKVYDGENIEIIAGLLGMVPTKDVREVFIKYALEYHIGIIFKDEETLKKLEANYEKLKKKYSEEISKRDKQE
ncbi:hypothetical protein [Brassicibacter mesophilus]|uniref:hypothetical protein n=1 Tax=Brassicibacter mesophilus TaxID=745119 RepID=UPI003D1D866C